VGLVCVVATLLGCARNPQNIDPCEKFNRCAFKFNDGLDRIVLKPVSKAYVKVVPNFIRTGVGNGFDNIGYLNVILNDLLQGKWGQGLGDAGRMAVNTTVGVVGVMDVASKWGLPSHKNDFGMTLGKWGSGPGPYLVLPLLGPSTGRDAPGILVARYTNPLSLFHLRPEVSLTLTVLDIVDTRSRLESVIQFRDTAALDPYVFTRDAYLQRRRTLIYGDQTPPAPDFYDVDTPATGPTTGATTREGVSQ
jgi:phospholipid-binding lipoprotein MlaA